MIMHGTYTSRKGVLVWYMYAITQHVYTACAVIQVLYVDVNITTSTVKYKRYIIYVTYMLGVCGNLTCMVVTLLRYLTSYSICDRRLSMMTYKH